MSVEVRQRLNAITELLNRLQETKRKQEAQCVPGSRTGVWLSTHLWGRLLKQLNTQMAELLEWEHMLVSGQRELVNAQANIQQIESAFLLYRNETEDKIAKLESLVRDLRDEACVRESEWEKTRRDLGLQHGQVLTDLHERSGVMRANEELVTRLKTAEAVRVKAEGAAREATERAAELDKQLKYLQSKHTDVAQERDTLVKEARELGLQLANTREQLETHKQLLGTRRQPTDELVDECKTLRDDNRRLVGLLSQTSEWKDIARRMSEEEGRMRYIPMHEVLNAKGGIVGVYPALTDRPINSREGKGGPSEEWNWVPDEAVQAVLDAVHAVHPNAPLEPLFTMLLKVNQIWRRREAKVIDCLKKKHANELRELHQLYRQRAPYEAVVGRTRLSELKRQLRLQAQHAQHLADKADGEAKAAQDDNKIILTLGLESVSGLTKQVNKLSKKTAKLRKRLAAKEKDVPVCTSCLDTLLLQSAPSLPRSHTNPVTHAELTQRLPQPAQNTTNTTTHTAATINNTAVPSHPRPTRATPATTHTTTTTATDTLANNAAPRTRAGLQATADEYVARVAAASPRPASANAGAGGSAVLRVRPGVLEGLYEAVEDVTGYGGGAGEVGSLIGVSVVSSPRAGSAGAASDRVTRLANLIREYERPVLQYSSWNRDGSLKDAGRVADLATGAPGSGLRAM